MIQGIHELYIQKKYLFRNDNELSHIETFTKASNFVAGITAFTKTSQVLQIFNTGSLVDSPCVRACVSVCSI